jgi:hypothetical protein
VGAAQQLLDEAAQAASDASVVVESDPETLQQLAMAEEKLARLEFLVESMLAAREEQPETEPVSTRESGVLALPGHRWESALPKRSTTFMGLQDDLFDPLIRTGIAAEFGSEAVDQIRKWRPLVSPGATVLINDAGQAVTYIDGVPTYLGNLAGDRWHSADESKLSGFFVGHSYTLRLNGTVEDRETGDTLAQVNPGSARKIGKKLKELIPNGGRLRVTTTGTVARYQDGEWVAMMQISPDDWFPAHL